MGTGKTTLALLVAKAARDAGRSVAVYSVPRLLAEMRDTFDEDSADSHLKLFRRLTEVELLVLDDLGAERQTEWVLEQLYSLVNERWQDERSTVVTSNVPDPYRDPNLATLRSEIGELRRRRKNGAGATSSRRSPSGSSGWRLSSARPSSVTTRTRSAGSASRWARER